MKEEMNFKNPVYYKNRELSWLLFNYRVLSEARDKSIPLFERLKFLSITASNLDEFFMIRVASLKDLVNAKIGRKDIAGLTPEEQLRQVNRETHELVYQQYSTYNRSLLPLLKEKGIHLISSHEELNKEQKKYVVVPEEAETVRRMFQLYLQGISLRKIASTLNQAGQRTVNGCRFTEVSVNSTIHNEIYAGDLRRQKYFVEDPISKRKMPNRGYLPQYYIQDCHEAVLDRETYTKVQDEIARRAALARRTCCFSGKIRCGICGNRYIRKKSTVKGRTYVYWVCRGKKAAGMTCANINLKEEELKQNYMREFGREAFDEKDFENQVREILVLRGGALEFCC